jgi:hypothetical protein
MGRKYTKEVLQNAVAGASSLSEAMRSLGVKPSGGYHSYFKRLLKKDAIDVSHFKRYNISQHSGHNRKTWQEMLCISESRPSGKRLQDALIESGVEKKCHACGLPPEWNGHKLVLEVHHKNENWLDNRKENLELLCPNCHSQKHHTDKAKKDASTWRTKHCPSCGVLICKKSKKCKDCANQCRKKKIEWPSADILNQMLQISSYVGIGRTLGVSDNAVRKHMEKMASSYATSIANRAGP